MGSTVKNQVDNRIFKIFTFRGQNIDVSDQTIFTLKYLGLHDEEGKTIIISDPLTVNQKRSGSFLMFIMTAHLYQADTTFKHSHMACRACVQFPLYVDDIDAIIYNKILKNPHIILFHLAVLENGRNPYIGTFKKYKGGGVFP